jgi:ATP-dependent helicase/nuclease subunit B
MPPEPWLAYARALDKPTEDTLPIESPQPMPPVDVRPRQLSVSEIRRWIRDPYAIYARHVLGLKVLDPLDAPADAALRGQIIHEICEIFASDDFDPAAEDALTRLLAKAGAVFDSHRVPHDIRAFWHARFEQTARWLLAGEIVRRAEGEEILAAEVKGALDIAAPGGTFTLTGRADRIDRRRDGTLIIADYKTGQAPTERQMSTGLEPQLPLEALMARKGAFGDIGAGRPSILRVIRLMGGAKPGELTDIQKADDLAGAAEQALLALIARYNDPDYPYRSRPVPQFLRHEGPYDHLARVKEWSAGEIDEEGV